MKKTKRILVKSRAGSYAVLCGAGALAGLSKEIAKIGEFSSVQVVTSPKVWVAVGKKVLRGLGGAKATRVHTFDDAETRKNLQSVEGIARSLVQAGADRHTVVVVVGGGVVGDVAGFTAGGYLGGGAVGEVPTTVGGQRGRAGGGKKGGDFAGGGKLGGGFC